MFVLCANQRAGKTSTYVNCENRIITITHCNIRQKTAAYFTTVSDWYLLQYKDNSINNNYNYIILFILLCLLILIHIFT